MAAAEYSIAAKESNETCLANVYGSCLDSMAGNPPKSPDAMLPPDSSIRRGMARIKSGEKFGSVTCFGVTEVTKVSMWTMKCRYLILILLYTH